MFSSVTHKLRGVRVEEYAYYVKKHRQDVGLETWIWRQTVTYKLRGARVEEIAHYIKKLRQNVGLETWTWCQSVTSQIADTKYTWPPYTTEWTPPWEFSAYATAQDKSCKEIINEQDKEKFKQDFLKMIRI